MGLKSPQMLMEGVLLVNGRTHHHSPQLILSQLNFDKLSMVLEALEQSTADHFGITGVGDVDLSDNTTRRHLASPRFSTAERLDVQSVFAGTVCIDLKWNQCKARSLKCIPLTPW